MSFVARKAVEAIDWYRRVVSPRKGFSCAYRAVRGGRSCAGVVRFEFAEHGARAGMRALCTQPFRCHEAARMLRKRRNDGVEWPKIEGLAMCCIPFLGI